MRSVLRFLLLTALPIVSPLASDTVSVALSDVVAAYSRAAPHLSAVSHGVDVAAYRDALLTGRFTSPHWGQPLQLDLQQTASADGSCGRFAAYVRLPPRNDEVVLVLCPQFVDEGTPELRRLTILHEMVHVVAGPDECRAMAFAAQVENLAEGRFTPVDRYWQANNCANSGFSLP